MEHFQRRAILGSPRGCISGGERMRKFLFLTLLFLLPFLAKAQEIPAGFTKLANVSAVTYTDATCPNLTTCYYIVTAVDSTGAESQPSGCSITGQLCVNGNEAVAQMPSSGTHTVLLSWIASSTPGVTYNVYQHIGPLPGNFLKAVVN